ncbi:hypothetical protein FGB62_50g213 [Gracilaria domingensis]|nr:hypothetical protein FGB62_50g213 [Gracilaria domingensis]
MFSRCASLDDQGWLLARVINITFESEDRRKIRCVKDTERPVYRNLERFPPFVTLVTTNTSGFAKDIPVYQPNFTVKVDIDEGPLEAFTWWSGPDVDPQTQYAQVKNVTVVDTDDMRCFFWRAPLHVEANILGHVSNRKLTAFVCQNETGNVVDYYGVSAKDLPRSNVRILSGNESRTGIVSSQYTVSTEFRFVGSLEFKDEKRIHGGHFIRRLRAPSISSQSTFQSILRQMLYERASNVTIRVPGDAESSSVQLDGVVVIVGSMEILSVVAFALFLKLYLKHKRIDVQKVNTVNGLSQCWAWNGTAEVYYIDVEEKDSP